VVNRTAVEEVHYLRITLKIDEVRTVGESTAAE
jgi:hypothetical protein